MEEGRKGMFLRTRLTVRLSSDWEVIKAGVIGAPGATVPVTTASQCLTDSFSVLSSTGQSPPTICGQNSGEHMYVDSTASCNDLVFQLGGTGRGTGIGQRQWSIKASECCGYGKGMGKNFDCLIVPGALDPLMMSKQGKFDQFCGRSAGLVGTTSTAAVMMSQTICSDRQPFNIRFLSDGFEADMEIGAGVMPGFKLTYFQTSNGCNA
ncbi:hypothetical protein TCAL_13742 [Tigriopus californicus]|uniref:CUB domain-containing protein n=1 Tax=Tigriopus californicus TaxID=6832 RepID=A0A553PU10_TIGCA|nr:hypothetical protein TCAL_13742 [Tigriopus californicus]